MEVTVKSQKPNSTADHFGNGGFDLDFPELELIFPSFSPIAGSTEGGNPLTRLHISYPSETVPSMIHPLALKP